ncbi:MMPL family transporter [Spongiactinospora sp. 9N601]|uniref:MMPL family transporter n=1 Tax=Spongiactinospora sp. 9N601 TaxID=3375149 RepID=UPI0037B8DF55
MSSFLYRLGGKAARARSLVLGAWVLALALAGGAMGLLQQGTDDAFTIPGSESQDALDHLSHVFPEVSGTSARLVIVLPEGSRADTPTVRRAVDEAVRDLERVAQVAVVTSPFGKDVKNAVSPDGRAAMIALPLDVPQAETTPETRQRLQEIGAELAKDADAKVYVGGDAFSNPVPGLTPTEGIGLVIAFLTLFLVFRSLMAAVMPLATAVFGVGVAVALIFMATVFTPISSTAPMLAVMLGLAVGIDYALFILSRHRDQLREGLAVEESIARATATAGSAVVFAGLTVVIALLGLAVAGIPFLTTMGVAAAFAVCVGVAVAVTATPALLALTGERLRPKPGRRRPGRKARVPLSRRWVRLATRRPLLTVAVVVAALGLCAIPAADLRLALPNSGTEEHGTPARDTFDIIAEHFGPGYNAPLIVSVDVLNSTDPVGVTKDIAAEIERLDGVAAVPVATPNRKGDTAIIQVVPDSAGDSPGTEALVQRLRDQAPRFQRDHGVTTAVTGFTAVGIDVSDRLAGALVPFGLVVVGLSLVLLAMVFRSIAVPIKAALGYLLSVGAAFGATSFVFQQGHLAQAFGVQHTGSVISFLPIILMGVLFGLAMDYEVFLLSRMREDYVHHGDPHRAIESGFVSAAAVVVAAAVIMFAVFAAFVPEGSATIKPIAFSLAVGVFVDAFVVRMTLVPAVLALLGHRAWWLPGRLARRLPVFDAEGEGLTHELRLAGWPGAPEVVSAEGLTVRDDRGRPVFSGVTVHLPAGHALLVHGPGASALLHTLAGRVAKVEGDLKVGGHLVPQHARAARRVAALIPCRTSHDPAAEATAALADGARLLVLEDLDAVVHPRRRAALARLLAGLGPAAAVASCHDPALLRDLLPPGTTDLSLDRTSAGVR